MEQQINAKEKQIIKNKKTLTGVVVSDVNDKTIIVKVARRFPHPKYKKIVTSYKKYVAHDPQNEAKNGDVVIIASSRPLSKTKRWRLVKIESRKVGQ